MFLKLHTNVLEEIKWVNFVLIKNVKTKTIFCVMMMNVNVIKIIKNVEKWELKLF